MEKAQAINERRPMALDFPISQPEVHSVIRVASTELSEHSKLKDLVALINDAFVTSWATIPGLVGRDRKRYESAAEFANDMGASGVCFVALDHDGQPIATAGYKPWNALWKTVEVLKAQKEDNGLAPDDLKPEAELLVEDRAKEGEGPAMENDMLTPPFEVVAVAVSPRLQKRGLATSMVRIVEQELQQRARAAGSQGVRLLVRTGKENNELYWARNGYSVVGQMYFDVGDFGSQTGFTILDMQKVILV